MNLSVIYNILIIRYITSNCIFYPPLRERCIYSNMNFKKRWTMFAKNRNQRFHFSKPPLNMKRKKKNSLRDKFLNSLFFV